MVRVLWKTWFKEAIWIKIILVLLRKKNLYSFSTINKTMLFILHFTKNDISVHIITQYWIQVITSYLASSQAQHLVTIGGCMSKDSCTFSHSVLLRGPSSMYQMSWCSMTVALMVTQPLPAGGAVQRACKIYRH